jgi:hypothetical protein
MLLHLFSYDVTSYVSYYIFLTGQLAEVTRFYTDNNGLFFMRRGLGVGIVFLGACIFYIL